MARIAELLAGRVADRIPIVSATKSSTRTNVMSQSGSTAGGTTGPRRRRRRQLIRVVGPIRPSTGIQRLRRSLRGGGFSAVVSVSTHVLIVTVMTW
ncbi:MAG TPA: hypothetical protein DCE43_06755, partial [Planctomycetaceae bacterium]|nr:hypothetical protein [Planctomycetaceae bacterium]